VTQADGGSGAPRRSLADRIRALFDSTAKRSNIVTALLLGVVSLLIAFTAFQASQYSDEAARLDSVANRISVDTINQYQDAYSKNQTDIQVWLQIVGSGQTVEESPLGALLSPGFLDAIERDRVLKGGTQDQLVLPTDDRYWQELTVSAQSKNDQLEQAYDAARKAGAISSRLTGASVIYSAALLLLTIGTSSGRHNIRLAMSGAATAIIVIALIIGAAPLRWFS
jgi:hypothetical protein